MELFDKLYGCYYNILRHMLTLAADHPITRQEMEELCRAYGFQESALAILPRIMDHTWPLLEENESHAGSHAAPRTYRSRLLSPPSAIPLTSLQKAWLRALLSDPRMSLFLDSEETEELASCLADVNPLYHEGDFYYFDRYKDGDPYDSPEYRKCFQTILTALREHTILLVAYEGKKGRIHTFETAPYQLQYSSRDDKFRLCCLQYRHGHFSRNTLLNLGRIKACRISEKAMETHTSADCPALLDRLRFKPVNKASEPVLLKISGERNSLERCMLHFANYEKHTEYDEDQACWLCSIYYDLADETELLIDILSFGPVVQVLGPESFVRQIRERVRRQHELFYGVLDRNEDEP